MLYMDYCATTPPYSEVIETISECMRIFYGNPSSLHRVGLEAEDMLRKARQVTASALGVKPSEIVFTSGGTESNNTALKGVSAAYRSRGRHIITSAIEHASVYEAARQLEADGYRVTFLPVDETGAVSVRDVEQAITKDTIMVSLMAVNNETGRIQPVEEVGRMLLQYPKIVYHVDAVQALGKIRTDVKAWNADLASFSAHKFRGPKGVGFLYRREGVNLVPLLAGGGQEMGLRSGTENVPVLVGMAKAVRMAVEKQPEATARMYGLRSILTERLKHLENVLLHGSPEAAGMAPHVVHFSCPGYKPEVVIHALEERGICISTRSACASGEETPSRVLQAMGLGREEAATGLRVSFSSEHTEQDMERMADELERVLNTISPKTGGRGR
ncbi:cysteine desulfurase family protein [Gorillibacterium sp. sgz5001074]|uniref:cysteine desulfurase family protein n=1 Tax=Gorillibacterium sp. sgz5001074 TaxID=3446695 RepID=UPI003F6770D9